MAIRSLKTGVFSRSLLVGNTAYSPIKATGGTITIAGGYVIHTFTSSGTFLPSANLTADYLVVAGGGGSGGGYESGGAGAGGLRSTVTATGGGGSLETALSLGISAYTVTVGSGSGSFDSTTGLVTFTGSSTITVNGVFSSNYQAYKILFRTTSATAGATCTYRFAQGGTATTASLWYGHGFYYGINGAPAAISVVNAGTEFYCQSVVSTGYGNLSTASEITIQNNRYTVQASGFPNNAGGVNAYALYNLASMSPLDGFRLAVNTGNITGTIKVYGYN
jgi:hypothetical protein